jgi:acetylornithine deacetylase/succinyl-diaminopimelate desuccinylase-like protein
VAPNLDAEVLRRAGVKRGWGETGFSAYERVVARPSLTIAGVAGGHRGPGVAAVIPARASAKLSMRLVPDQSADRVEALLRARLRTLMPPTVRWELTRVSASPPVLLNRGDVAHEAAARACRRIWRRAPAVLRSGGTIPLVDLIARRYGVPTVLLGFALPDDGAHAPDEKFHTPHLDLGAGTIAAFLEELATARARRDGGGRDVRRRLGHVT